MKIFKRILVSMLVFILMLSSIQISASAEDVLTIGDYGVLLKDDGTLSLLQYYGSEKNVVIPSKLNDYTVTEINPFICSNCSNIESIYINKSIEKIEAPSGAPPSVGFNQSGNLKAIYVEEGNPEFKSVDGVLYNSDMTTLLVYPYNKSGSNFTIPKSVKSIRGYAFFNNKYLKDIIYDFCNIDIFDITFVNMQSLEKICYPYCGTGFVNCPNLRDVYIDKDVTTIYDTAFNNLPNVTLHVYKGSTAEQYAIEKNIPYVYRCIEDEATGIKVEGQFDKNTKLTIEKPGLDEFIEGVNAAYTLSLNAEFDSVDISIPCADATNFVYRYENNEYTKVNSVYEDGCYKFTVSKLGTYVIKTGDNVPKYSLGDVDGDGIVAVKDVTYIQLHLANLGSLTDEGKIAADYDKDGSLTVKDATYIQLYLANLL